MAGAGYRTWTAGEVVTASNVQSFLQDQTVGVYAGSAARSSAILSPSQGQLSYRTDDDIVEAYDGTNWVPVSAPSDSGLIHINTTSFSAVASQGVTAFNADYQNYKLIVNITATSTDMDLRLRFGNGGSANGDSNHQWAYWIRNNSGTNLSFDASNSPHIFLSSMETYSGTGSRFTNVALDIYNPFLSSDTGGNVQISTVNTSGAPTFGAGGFIKGGSTSWSEFYLLTSTGTMTGTVKLYGYRD
jgi:hypothetical protein